MLACVNYRILRFNIQWLCFWPSLLSDHCISVLKSLNALAWNVPLKWAFFALQTLLLKGQKTSLCLHIYNTQHHHCEEKTAPGIVFLPNQIPLWEINDFYGNQGYFNYNERGWLSGGSIAGFEFELKYENGSIPQYNGNISMQKWGVPGNLDKN